MKTSPHFKNKVSLQSHWLSPKQIRCAEEESATKLKYTTERNAGPMDIALKKLSEKNVKILKKVFNTAYSVLKSELPFKVYETMMNLQVKNESDIAQLSSYRSDNACRRFAKYISEDIWETNLKAIGSSRVLSVMYDGATDSSVTEVEIVYCRFLKNGHPVNCFVNLIDLQHAHADGVFDAIDRGMISAGVNWKEKLVGVGSDGASVNVGKKNSVATRIQSAQPHAVIIHCVAHRLELAVLDAIKEHDMLKTVQDMLKQI